MEPLAELKLTTASNIIKLRTAAGLTQSELGEKLNYSDKSISKWERGEALPDVSVLKRMADIFGVSVDYLICSHDEWTGVPGRKQKNEQERNYDRGMIVLVSIIGIWTLAVLVFVIFWSLGSINWMIFIAALPVMMITLLVFNSIWNKGRFNEWIVGGLVLSLFILVFLLTPGFGLSQMLMLLVPAEVIVALSFRIRKKPHGKSEDNTQTGNADNTQSDNMRTGKSPLTGSKQADNVQNANTQTVSVQYADTPTVGTQSGSMQTGIMPSTGSKQTGNVQTDRMQNANTQTVSVQYADTPTAGTQSGSMQTGIMPTTGSKQTGNAQTGRMQNVNMQTVSVQYADTPTADTQSGSMQTGIMQSPGSKQTGNVQIGRMQTGSMRKDIAHTAGAQNADTSAAGTQATGKQTANSQITQKELPKRTQIFSGVLPEKDSVFHKKVSFTTGSAPISATLPVKNLNEHERILSDYYIEQNIV